MSATHITAGPKGMILHVNRQFIEANAKHCENRPCYTIKPNGPDSVPIYARSWRLLEGIVSGVPYDSQLKCGARIWIEVEPGGVIAAEDAMPFANAKEAV